MDDSPCAHDAPTSPTWAQAALTAGVGIVAGLMLGRKGITGLAAGVAAMAGANLLKNACRHADVAPDDSTTAEAVDAPTEVLPPADPPLEIPIHEAPAPDWIDHDAVQFSHVVPDASFAATMLKDKELPLLDDDGLPVEHVAVQPVFPEIPDHKVEEAPLVWEPGRFIQSGSNGTSTTVWFGLHDVMPPAENPAPASSPPLVEQIAPGDAPSHHTPIITPKNTGRTLLPQPRQIAAISPADHAQEPTQLPPGLRLAGPGIPAVHHTQRVSQSRSSSSHRHLEPRAPSERPAPERTWPLTVLLSILVAIAIFLAIDRWTNGSLIQKLGQKLAMEQTLAPAAAAPSGDEPAPMPPAHAENSSNR
jgi:hypothetical protein